MGPRDVIRRFQELTAQGVSPRDAFQQAMREQEEWIERRTQKWRDQEGGQQ